MRVLVTGATGFIGRALCHRLRADAHEVVVLTRNVSKARRALPFADAIFAYNPDSSPPDEALEGVDAVVNLAGETVSGRWTHARKRRILDSRVSSTRKLVWAMRNAGVRTLVSASAIGFYGERGDEELTEESQAGKGFLTGVTRGWEEAARAAESDGARVVILRIGIVLGKGGGALQVMLPQFKLGLGSAIGNGRQWWSWVHRDDVVVAIETALTGSTWSGVYNLTAPEPARQTDFAHELAYTLGRPAVLPAPSIAIKAVLGEFSSEVLQSKRVLPARLLQQGFIFQHPQLGEALEDILGRPRLKTHRLTREQLVLLDIGTTFEFFSDAANLERLTPPWLNFRIHSTEKLAMGEGTLIDYRLRVHGVPISWRSEIIDWRPPHRFIDQQLRGPYRRWVHTHTFEETPEGTLMRDQVDYAVPGPGIIASRFVSRDLARIFDYRREALDAWVREKQASAE